MEIIKSLMELGYRVVFEYDPIEQLIYYTVWCGDELFDVGLADEMNWEKKLKEVCMECIQC